MKLKDAVNKGDREQERLEQVIIETVKKLYRLSGKPYYEPLVPELEKQIKGRG